MGRVIDSLFGLEFSLSKSSTAGSVPLPPLVSGFPLMPALDDDDRPLGD
jgi:hypothetical protein